MPTYNQLDDEAAWRAEIAAPGLSVLASALTAHWPGAEIGLRGDNAHLRGYHRSRRWIKESAFCTNRTYSVTRTAGDKAGGNSNWSCALDFGGIPQSELFAVCKRLDAAVRAGRLEKITEWYGNFGGDDRADGWDNIADRIASSDSSHLTHLHVGFDRGRADEDHSDLLAILIGDDMSWDETLTLPADQFPELEGQTQEKAGLLLAWTAARGRRLEVQLAEVKTKVDALSAPVPVHLSDGDRIAIAAMVAGELKPLIGALQAELRDAVADLGEGGAAQVRAGA